MVRQGKYKYIRYMYQDHLDELYDSEAEPEELYNPAVRHEYHNTKPGMRALLTKELKKGGAKFVSLLPEPKQTY